MVSSSFFHPLIFLLAVNFLLPLTNCGLLIKQKYIRKCDYNHQNYVATEQINVILTILQTWTPINGFYSTSLNTSVYGLAWCNIDHGPFVCNRCMANAITIIKKDCGDKNIVGAYYMEDFCYLRFNMVDFRGKLDTFIGIFSHSPDYVKHLDHMDEYESNMMKLFYNVKKFMKEKRPKNMYAQNYNNIKRLAKSQTLYWSGLSSRFSARKILTLRNAIAACFKQSMI